jgi:hypothetical protein
MSVLTRYAFERRGQPLLPRRLFLRRLLVSFGLGMVLVVVSLLIGMLGYHVYEQLSWLDAFLNSAMLLGGMGPVDAPKTPGGKIFAGIYSLYCGLMVIAIVGVMFAPIFHRFLHKFHLEKKDAS